MNVNYKLSKEIKWTFILNVLLFFVAMFFHIEIAIATSVIIFVILSVSIQILEAIHDVGDKSN